MGIMIFLVCILLKTVEIKLGVALGLFAIFAILRFRSRNVALRDMTYFFTVLGISVINALASFLHPVRGPFLINGVIIISLLILEHFFHKKSKLSNCQLLYDKLELLNPERKQELLSDLSSRAGIKVEKARICRIDLTKGQAELEVFYKNSKKSDESLS
jgi:Zn-dependent protease with chaperone function